MKNLFIVHWGSASQDDDGNTKAYTGIHGVYSDIEKAKNALIDCRDITYDEVVQSDDPEDLEENKRNTRVYGSIEEGFFEIDYLIGDIPCEIYITITIQQEDR